MGGLCVQPRAAHLLAAAACSRVLHLCTFVCVSVQRSGQACDAVFVHLGGCAWLCSSTSECAWLCDGEPELTMFVHQHAAVHVTVHQCVRARAPRVLHALPTALWALAEPRCGAGRGGSLLAS